MARRRRPPTPRTRPHPYRPDPAAADHRGTPICRCGAARGASCHRSSSFIAAREWLDVARLAAGERDD